MKPLSIPNIENRDLTALLALSGACQPARVWLEKRDLKTALRDCPNLDWLLWAFNHLFQIELAANPAFVDALDALLNARIYRNEAARDAYARDTRAMGEQFDKLRDEAMQRRLTHQELRRNAANREAQQGQNVNWDNVVAATYRDATLYRETIDNLNRQETDALAPYAKVLHQTLVAIERDAIRDLRKLIRVI